MLIGYPLTRGHGNGQGQEFENDQKECKEMQCATTRTEYYTISSCFICLETTAQKWAYLEKN